MTNFYDDTGLNFPEPVETLCEQQKQLLEGKRVAQMFPKGTEELPLLKGFERAETDRGIFHFNPLLVSHKDVQRVSLLQRENELLALGPYNKADVIQRAAKGENILVVTERTREWVEVKAALGTQSTARRQIAAFERTKSSGSIVGLETPMQVLNHRAMCAGRL